MVEVASELQKQNLSPVCQNLPSVYMVAGIFRCSLNFSLGSHPDLSFFFSSSKPLVWYRKSAFETKSIRYCNVNIGPPEPIVTW